MLQSILLVKLIKDKVVNIY